MKKYQDGELSTFYFEHIFKAARANAKTKALSKSLVLPTHNKNHLINNLLEVIKNTNER